MTNGTFGLSFWLAVAGGILAFGVSLVVGHAGLLLAAIIGGVVFLILWAILGFAMTGKAQSGKAQAAAPVAQPAAPAKMDTANAETTAPAAVMAAPAAAMAAPVAKAEAAAKPAAAPAAAKPAAKAEAKPAAAKAADKVAPAATAPAKVAKSAAKADEPSPGTVGKAPATLTAARGGRADDLKIIEGIGPKMEQLINSLGFYHYDQIAGWSADEVAWVDSHLGTFRGRIVRDKWQAQAKLIVAEGIPAFLERAKTNNY